MSRGDHSDLQKTKPKERLSGVTVTLVSEVYKNSNRKSLCQLSQANKPDTPPLSSPPCPSRQRPSCVDIFGTPDGFTRPFTVNRCRTRDEREKRNQRWLSGRYGAVSQACVEKWGRKLGQHNSDRQQGREQKPFLAASWETAKRVRETAESPYRETLYTAFHMDARSRGDKLACVRMVIPP